MGWHCLVRLYKFQVQISMMHNLYIAMCTHHPQSDHPSPYIGAPVPFTTPTTPFAAVATPMFSVSEFSFVCFSVCSFLAFSFISHRWVKSFGSYHGPSVLQTAVSHRFLWLSSVPRCMCRVFLMLSPVRGTLVLPRLGHRE